MIALQRFPVLRLSFFDRQPLLGRARLGQQQQQMAPGDNLAMNGAILQATVSVPSAYAQGGGAGTPKTLTAMIDSGASISCITIQGAQSIGIPQVSSTQLGGVGGMTNAPVYGASITLPQFNVTVDPVQIAGVANPLPGVDMLIGRDILRQLIFTYKGGEGVFTLSQDTGVAAGGAPPTGTAAGGQPIPTQPMPGVPPAGGQAVAPPPPQANLPQPPVSEGTVLGMKPLVAAGVGVGILAAGAGALALFKVI